MAILILNIIVSALFFKLAVSIKYSRRAAFTAALIFSVLACHSETLFFINCINEIFSAAFILAGLYFMTKNESLWNIAAVIIFFLLALFSRESAVCYIPLAILVNFKIRKYTPQKTILLTLIPLVIYVLFRYISEMFFSESNLNSSFESLDLNPLKAFYKMLHYFVSMIFPVKIIFAIAGYDNLEFLIKAFRKPTENLPVFLALSFMVSIVFFSVILIFIKTLKKEIIFPLIFIFAALFIYLFSFNTAERFLYLPSAGLCILFGIFFEKLRPAKISFSLLTIFLIIHSASLISREYAHKEAAEYSEKVMRNLANNTEGIHNGAVIYFENIPPKMNGIFFLSPYNFQSNWDYNYPGKKYTFYFKETVTDESLTMISNVFMFDAQRNEFVKLK